MPARQQPELTGKARDLRARQTKAESLLWNTLRGRRMSGLKFRRQVPFEPFIVDFACIERRLIVELDGGYHEYVEEQDASRQEKLEATGWKVFSNEDVLENVEAVAVAIARELGLEAEFLRGKRQ